VYLFTAVDLARRARFTLWQMAAMVGAGFIPFLAFVVEARVARRVAPLLAEEEAGNRPPGPGPGSEAPIPGAR
jgi:hypothetical protein